MKVNLGISSILTAMCTSSIGTKVKRKYKDRFITKVKEAIECFDFDSCRQPGQALIELKDVSYMVSGGVGKRVEKENAYIIKKYRGKVGLYLKRKYALKPNSVSIVVYTKDAYLKDPDIGEETQKVFDQYTHILVAILASCGPQSTLTPGRFVANLAGGNNEALLWTADEIRQKAKEINEYSKTYCVVAD